MVPRKDVAQPYAATRRFHRLAFAALLFSFTLPALAQVGSTPFRQYQSVYTPLSTGTMLANAGAVVTAMTSGSLDDGYWTVAMPFSVTLGTSASSTIYVGTNGYVTFGTGTTSLSGILSQAVGTGAVAALSRDMDLRGTAASASYAVQGSAPNRVFVIQMKDISTYPSSTYTTDRINFQYRLYEGSNRIDIVYGVFTTTASTTNAQVGIRGNSTVMTNVSNRSVVSGTSTWSTTTAGTVNTASCSYTSALKPSEGWTFSWGCETPPPGAATLTVTDAGGAPVPYVNLPGTLYLQYSAGYPLATAYTVNVQLSFFRIDAPGSPALTAAFAFSKPAGSSAVGVYALPASLSPGFYRIDAVFQLLNGCGLTENVPVSASTLVLAPGMVPCTVWPGDVNNDGFVNYGDRTALNKYILDANLRPTWLSGPARYRNDAGGNPASYYTWEPQAGVPWQNADGCYMDTDGNGTVNNLDQLAIRLNWLRNHAGATKPSGSILAAASFDMMQNYPNPFNPTTTISLTVPEASHVELVVTDLLGRELATLVRGELPAGTHQAAFDAAGLASGKYLATVRMTGMSGLSFAKTIVMTLAK
jgi:hypothetical protein